eukprot:COSAG01_NODE_2743_length_7151_cov_1.870817_6_plen_56_part_00
MRVEAYVSYHCVSKQELPTSMYHIKGLEGIGGAGASVYLHATVVAIMENYWLIFF